MTMEKGRKDSLMPEEGKTICVNCGAEFDERLTACPYCNALHDKSAIRAHFGKLEKVRADMDELDSAASVRQDAKKETKRVLKIVIIIAAIVAGLFILLAVLNFTISRSEETRIKEEYYWEQENFPLFDEYYEKGDYTALLSVYQAAADEGHNVWNWSHSLFCDMLESGELALNWIEIVDFTNPEDLAYLLYDELTFLLRYETEEDLTEKDKEALSATEETIREDFTERFAMSTADYEDFLKIWEKDGWISYEACLSYVEEHIS